METFSALLALCAGNSPMTGDFRARRPVTLSFGVFFDLRLYKLWSKEWWGWWFETPSCPLWCHCNEITTQLVLMLRSEFLCVLVRCLRCWIMHSKMLHTSVQYRAQTFRRTQWHKQSIHFVIAAPWWCASSLRPKFQEIRMLRCLFQLWCFFVSNA